MRTAVWEAAAHRSQTNLFSGTQILIGIKIFGCGFPFFFGRVGGRLAQVGGNIFTLFWGEVLLSKIHRLFGDAVVIVIQGEGISADWPRV